MAGDRIGKREHKRKVCIEMEFLTSVDMNLPSFPRIQTLSFEYLYKFWCLGFLKGFPGSRKVILGMENLLAFVSKFYLIY